MSQYSLVYSLECTSLLTMEAKNIFLWLGLFWTILYFSCISMATADISGAHESPFKQEKNKVPSYMMDIYRKISNPRAKICHDRTYVSLPNLVAETAGSICSPGKIRFSLRRDSEIGRFLHSGRLYIELMGAITNQRHDARKVVVALSFKNNDTLLGYTEIEMGKYDSIDITPEARHWWQRKEYDAPEININFYITHPKDMVDACSDVFWRVSTLVSWQNRRRCKRRIRRPRHSLYSSEMTSNDDDYADYDDQEDQSYMTLNELKQAVQESRGLKEITERRKRSVPDPTHVGALLAGQKAIFFNSLKKQEEGADTPTNNFSETILKYLLNSEKKLAERASEFIEKNRPSLHKPAATNKATKPLQPKISRAPRMNDPFSTNGRRCCTMKKKIINFKKLKLDWILAPTEYQSGRCTGQCRFPIMGDSNPTTYSIFSSIQRFLQGKGRYPSCTPAKMGSMTLLLQDTNNQIVLQNVYDMVVKSCGCR